MKKLYMIIVMLSNAICLNAQQLLINLKSPDTDFYVAHTSIYIQAYIMSTYQLTTVTATIGNRTIPLPYTTGPTGAFYGSFFPLDGLPEDTLTLKIEAEDIYNNTAELNRQIIHDEPPIITVDSPYNEYVARPFLRLKARATDHSTIKEFSVSYLNVSKTFSGNSIDTVLDLSDFVDETTYIPVRLQATDDRNQITERQLIVFADTNPYLAEYFTTPDSILDFRHDRVFIVNKLSSQKPRIVNIPGNTTTNIPFKRTVAGLNNDPSAHLTPYGAIFTGRDDSVAKSAPSVPSPTDSVYEWNNGTITFQHHSSLISIKTTGDYATWTSGGSNDSLYLRNLLTQQNTAIVASRPEHNVDVGTSGLVVFSEPNGIYEYQNGIKTVIRSGYSMYPKIDEERILFDLNDSLHLFEQTSIIGIDKVENPYQTQINNGFIAYRKYDSIPSMQVWLRDTNGQRKQITHWGTNAAPAVQALAENGNMLHSAEAGFYFYNHQTGQSRHFSNKHWWATGFYDNGHWYLKLGHSTIFKINLDTAINFDITPFHKTASPGATLHFATGDFLQHYTGPASGPGQLAKVEITALPAHGTLSINDFAISTGYLITRNALTNLAYTPTAHYEGTDTIRWKAYNGIDFTPYDTLLVIHVCATPAVTVSSNINPIVTLKDTINITASKVAGRGNMPLYTFAKDSLLTNILQSESPDSTLSLLPATLAIGNNPVWIHMKICDQACPVDSAAMDSINIVRSPITAIVDPLYPRKVITTFPNPFYRQFSVTGLQPTKIYTLSIYDMQGKLITRKKAYHQSKTEINIIPGEGTFLLRIFDDKEQRLIGTLKLVQLEN